MARAKVNLTLHVLGRRPDGYHDLESLVVFADTGDRLTLVPGCPLSLTISGPHGGTLRGDAARNLVLLAADAFHAAHSEARLGAFHLEKQLPVAAGIGGGSANAAAALRLLARANPDFAAGVDWSGIGARLGADVPVCLASRAAMMMGIGHTVRPLASLPEAAILLVNPGVPLATSAVFRALAAPPVGPIAPDAPVPVLGDREALVRLVAEGRNDLEPAAMSLCPPVGRVLAALWRLDGTRVARMSGSGPTCFALFNSLAEAEAARRVLAVAEPGWWMAAARIA